MLHFNQINIQASIKIQNRKHVNVEISQDLYHNEFTNSSNFFQEIWKVKWIYNFSWPKPELLEWVSATNQVQQDTDIGQ